MKSRSILENNKDIIQQQIFQAVLHNADSDVKERLIQELIKGFQDIHFERATAILLGVDITEDLEHIKFSDAGSRYTVISIDWLNQQVYYKRETIVEYKYLSEEHHAELVSQTGKDLIYSKEEIKEFIGKCNWTKTTQCTVKILVLKTEIDVSKDSMSIKSWKDLMNENPYKDIEF